MTVIVESSSIKCIPKCSNGTVGYIRCNKLTNTIQVGTNNCCMTVIVNDDNKYCFVCLCRPFPARGLPGSVLRSVPAAVRVVVFDDAGLLLDNVGTGARARHRRAQEYVDNEHNEEHEPERYAQVQEPRWPDAAVRGIFAQRQAAGRLAGLQHEHGRAGRQRAVLRLRVHREPVPGRLLLLLYGRQRRTVAVWLRTRAPAHLDVTLEV